MRRAARRDAGEQDIIKAMRACGAFVKVINDEGTFDLLCWYNGHTLLLEIKDGNKPPSARRLTYGKAFLSFFFCHEYLLWNLIGASASAIASAIAIAIAIASAIAIAIASAIASASAKAKAIASAIAIASASAIASAIAIAIAIASAIAISKFFCLSH